MFFIIKKTFIIFLVFTVFYIYTLPVFANKNTDYGLKDTINSNSELKTVYGEQQGTGAEFFATKIGQIIGVALSFVGVIFFVLIVYAGFLWMTARGDDKQVGEAKTLIQQAVIGLIIIFSAYAITSFIGSNIVE